MSNIELFLLWWWWWWWNHEYLFSMLLLPFFVVHKPFKKKASIVMHLLLPLLYCRHIFWMFKNDINIALFMFSINDRLFYLIFLVGLHSNNVRVLRIHCLHTRLKKRTHNTNQAIDTHIVSSIARNKWEKKIDHLSPAPVM